MQLVKNCYHRISCSLDPRRELTPVRLCSVRLSWRLRARPSATLHEIRPALRQMECFVCNTGAPAWQIHRPLICLSRGNNRLHAISKRRRIELRADDLIRAIRQVGHAPVAYKSDQLLRLGRFDIRAELLCQIDAAVALDINQHEVVIARPRTCPEPPFPKAQTPPQTPSGVEHGRAAGESFRAYTRGEWHVLRQVWTSLFLGTRPPRAKRSHLFCRCSLT